MRTPNNSLSNSVTARQRYRKYKRSRKRERSSIQRRGDHTTVLRPGYPDKRIRLYRTVEGEAYVQIENVNIKLEHYETTYAKGDAAHAAVVLYFRSWLAVHDWSLDREPERETSNP